MPLEAPVIRKTGSATRGSYENAEPVSWGGFPCGSRIAARTRSRRARRRARSVPPPLRRASSAAGDLSHLEEHLVVLAHALSVRVCSVAVGAVLPAEGFFALEGALRVAELRGILVVASPWARKGCWIAGITDPVVIAV